MARQSKVEFTSSTIFRATFSDYESGRAGRWSAIASGGTVTFDSGPGTNNALAFFHTETSAQLPTTPTADIEDRGIVTFTTIPNLEDRLLHIRLCIQGDFGDGREGLAVQSRASSAAAWAEVPGGFVYGWAYSDNYVKDAVFQDENGNDRTVAANGGWVDVTIRIPDDATQVRLRPKYIVVGNSSYLHDIALRSIQWEGTVPVQAGNPEERAARDARALHGPREVYALEITHPAINPPARVVSDNANHVLSEDGAQKTFHACAFDAELPQEVDGELRRARVRVDNVGKKLMDPIRDSKGGRGATMRVMSFIKPAAGEAYSTVSFEVTMSVVVSEIDNLNVYIELADETMLGRPGILIRHDPERSPGLF